MITQTRQLSSEDGLSKAIVYSIAAHVAVLAVFIVRMVIYPSEPLKLDDAIRVDMVALPDKAPKMSSVPVVEPAPPAPVEQPKPAEPEPAPAPVAVTKPLKPETPKVVLKPDTKKTKKAQDDAMKRLEALEKIERMTKSQSSAPRPAPVKGNQISHGGSLSGVIRLEQQGYLEQVHSSVQPRWNLPSYLAGANLSARVRIFVDGKGVVIKRAITQSSGNDVFDARLLAAIDASSPLQPPPDSLSGILENDGMEIAFSP